MSILYETLWEISKLNCLSLLQPEVNEDNLLKENLDSLIKKGFSVSLKIVCGKDLSLSVSLHNHFRGRICLWDLT